MWGGRLVNSDEGADAGGASAVASLEEALDNRTMFKVL